MWSLLCIPPLAAMVVSDLRSRRIGVTHLIILGVTLTAASLICRGWGTVVLDIVFNLLTILLLWMCLYCYARLRNMKLKDMIGGGDLGFAIAVTPYFSTGSYVKFLIVSSALTLTVWSVAQAGVKRPRNNHQDWTQRAGIPLVTGMGVCLGAVIAYKTIII